MNQKPDNKTKELSPFYQYVPKNVQGPNMLGADDGSGKSNAVMDAYNDYQERERQAWAKLFGGK
jgi:hypothetical protein